MKRVYKLIAFVLVLALAAGMVPAVAANESAADETVNYVVVLDVSPSTEDTDDKEVMEQAGKMVVDLLPVENAQVGVVTFGYYDSSKAYRFREMKPKSAADSEVVRELVPLQGTADKAEKDAVIKTLDLVDQLAKKAIDQDIIGQSPVGLSIMAAVDMLKQADSAKEKACIIVISDGVRKSEFATRGDYTEIETVAAAEAKKMGWPIYCLRLTGDSEKITPEQRTNAKSDMANTVKTTGAFIDANNDGTIGDDEKGSYAIRDLEDISLAIMQILAQYSGGDILTIELDDNGYASEQFDIPELASEATATVTGVALNKIRISDENGNILCEAEGDKEVPQKYITTKRKGPIEDYIIAQLIAPDKTRATVEVYGKANATVHALVSTSKDVQLQLELFYKDALDETASWIAVDSDTTLKKDCQLRFEAYFTYAGHHYKNCTAYAEAAPKLTVNNLTSGSKLPHVLDMNGNESGFYLEMSMSDFGVVDSIYEASVEVSHSTLDGGSRLSNTVNFKTIDIISEQIGDFTAPVTAGLNEDLEIGLDKYIENKDGDKLACAIQCQNNANLTFVPLDSESDVLKFNTGMTDGEHQLLITLTDPSGPVHELHLTLNVQMQPIEGGDAIRLLKEGDNFPDFLNWALGKAELPETTSENISDAFYANGLNVMMVNASADNSKVAVCEGQNGNWTVRGLSSGSTVVDVELTAEVLDANGELRVFSKTLDVEVVSRWSLFWDIWLMWIILLLAVLLAIAIVLFFRQKGKGLKNLWSVTISTQSGEVHKCSRYIDLYEYSGEAEITMLRLMDEQIIYCLDILNGAYSTKAAAVKNVINYWKENDGLNQVKLLATYKPTGFEAELSKDASNISMFYDDAPVKGNSLHVSDRELKVVFAEGDNRLVITMEMTTAEHDD